MVGRKWQAADCPAAVTEQAWGLVSLELWEWEWEWEWDSDLMTLAAGAMGWSAAEAGSDQHQRQRQRQHGGLSLIRGRTQGYPPCLSRLDAS